MQRKRSESAIAKDKLHATLLLLLRLLSMPQCTQPQPSPLAPAQVLLLSRRIFLICSSIFMVPSVPGREGSSAAITWGDDDVLVLVVCEGRGCEERSGRRTWLVRWVCGLRFCSRLNFHLLACALIHRVTRAVLELELRGSAGD